MNHYIKSMRGSIGRARGYGQDGFELRVDVAFDSKQFNEIKKTANPLAVAMGQIKNVVLDACGVRGIPSYARTSMHQEFPRASKGIVRLTLYFDVSEFLAKDLGVDTKDYIVHKSIDLNSTLEATRNDGHLFAKTAIAARMGH